MGEWIVCDFTTDNRAIKINEVLLLKLLKDKLMCQFLTDLSYA